MTKFGYLSFCIIKYGGVPLLYIPNSDWIFQNIGKCQGRMLLLMKLSNDVEKGMKLQNVSKLPFLQCSVVKD